MVRKLHISEMAHPLVDIGMGDLLARSIQNGAIPHFSMDDKTYYPPEFYVRSEVSLEDAKQKLATMLQVAGLLVSDTTDERAQVVFFSRGEFMSKPTSKDGSAPRKSGDHLFHWMLISLSVIIGDEVYMTTDGRDFVFADKRKEEGSIPTQFVTDLLALINKHFVPRGSIKEPRATIPSEKVA